jgi:hypothetical protein
MPYMAMCFEAPAALAPSHDVGVFFFAKGPQDEDIVYKLQDRMMKLQRTCMKKPKVDNFGLR